MIFKQPAILLLLLLTFLKLPSSSAILGVNGAFAAKKPIRNKNSHKAVVGGYKCPIENHPFLVSLRLKDAVRHFCGGSLLSKFWVLTAFHCVEFKRSNVQVIAGSNFTENISSILNNEKHQLSEVEQFYFYPQQDKTRFDICLLRLKDPILEAANVGYVKLPFELNNGNESLIDTCSNATIMGWGLQYAIDSMFEDPIVLPIPENDPHLQCSHISVISNEDCKNSNHLEDIFPAFFCAYHPTSDTCKGDSGGPLMCNGYQYGIVSHGHGCAYDGYAGVYTNILYFQEFISTTMESLPEDKNPANTIHFVKLSVVTLILGLNLIN